MSRRNRPLGVKSKMDTITKIVTGYGFTKVEETKREIKFINDDNTQFVMVNKVHNKIDGMYPFKWARMMGNRNG